jgi:uncharacterized protein YukE
MNLVHVEPDSLHLGARSLLQEYYALANQLYALRVARYRLEMAWQGGDAEAYLFEMRALLQRLDAQMSELLTIGLTLSHQADAWDECDQRWTGIYRGPVVLQTGE